MSKQTPSKQSDAEQLLNLKNTVQGYGAIIDALNDGTFQVKHLQNVANALTFLTNLKKGANAQINTLEEKFYAKEGDKQP